MYINGLYLAVRNTLKTQPRRPCLLTYASQRAPVIGRSGYTSESLPCKLQPHFYMHKRRPRVEEQPEWMRAHILHVVLYPPVASHQKALWLHNAKNWKATCPVRPTRRSLLVRYLHSRHFVGQPPRPWQRITTDVKTNGTSPLRSTLLSTAQHTSTPWHTRIDSSFARRLRSHELPYIPV